MKNELGIKNNQAAGVASKPATPSPAIAAPTSAKTTSTKPDAAQLGALTERMAYDLWEKRGKKSGHALTDWLEAEKLARQKLGL